MCADCHARQAGIREAAAAAAREKARELARVASAERAEETARARRQPHGFPRITPMASSRDYTARACKMHGTGVVLAPTPDGNLRVFAGGHAPAPMHFPTS